MATALPIGRKGNANRELPVDGRQLMPPRCKNPATNPIRVRRGYHSSPRNDVVRRDILTSHAKTT